MHFNHSLDRSPLTCTNLSDVPDSSYLLVEVGALISHLGVLLHQLIHGINVEIVTLGLDVIISVGVVLFRSLLLSQFHSRL